MHVCNNEILLKSEAPECFLNHINTIEHQENILQVRDEAYVFDCGSKTSLPL